MKNLRPLLLIALFVATALSPAHAQVAGHARVSGTDISGLELTLEGATSATRGSVLRWFVVAHEVIGLSTLRPAQNAEVRVVSSMAPNDAGLRVTTDSYGRAAIELPIPADAPLAFMVSIDLVGRQHVHRRFDLPIRTINPELLTVQLTRSTYAPGMTARAFGRLINRETLRPMSGVEVEVEFLSQGGAPLAASQRVRTDVGGMFASSLRLPRSVRESITVVAKTGANNSVNAQFVASITEPQHRGLLVALAPRNSLMRPLDATRIAVVVRSVEGRPIAHARVQAGWNEPGNVTPHAETDAYGRAELPYHSPDLGEPYTDVSLAVQATKVGYEGASGVTQVRIARAAYAAAIVAESGHLPEALGGIVWVRAVNIDGTPAAANTPVRIRGPRISEGGLLAQTDASGMAAFDIRLLAHDDASDDACGGLATTSLTTTVGEGSNATNTDHCLPLDPDATLRVRLASTLVSRGAHIPVELTRTSSVRDLPIAITALSVAADGAMRPVASTVVGARDAIAELALPANVVGRVVVRARPLHGTERIEVRGGVTALWVSPGERTEISAALASNGRASYAFSGNAQGERSVYSVALPLDEARALFASTTQMQSPFAAIYEAFGQTANVSEAFQRSLLSSLLNLDVDAPAVLRGNVVVPFPATQTPEDFGHLRDPWRARARFVGGRLALLFRAIESAVEQAVPGNIDNVAVQGPRGWEFNERILDTIDGDAQLGDGGATALGGDALDMSALRAIDASFTYDNVARRITRKRLFSLLIDLRTFVRDHELDLRWGVRGDPSEWLRQATEEPTRLADAWGHPIELRPARGNSRFTLLVPVPGYELVSAGPNGRFGDADDVWNPTARVLSETSVYGQAVGENLLVARLQGVEIGRATVQSLSSVFDPPVFEIEDGASSIGQVAPSALPSRLINDPYALALRRPNHPGDGAGGSLNVAHEASLSVDLALDEEPRTWGLVALSSTHEGYVSVTHAEARSGAPLLVEEALPTRVNVHEPVTLPLHVTNVSDNTVSVAITAFENTQLRIRGARTLSLRPQESAVLDANIEGLAPGSSQVRLSFVANGREAKVLEGELRVARGLHPIRRRATGLATDRAFRGELLIPDNAIDAEARVVVVTHDALADDPEFADARREDPALFAWFYAMQGKPLPSDLRAQLLRAQSADGSVAGTETNLSTLAAIAAWAAADPSDRTSALARGRAMAYLGRMRGSLDTSNSFVNATYLLALAMGGAADPLDDGLHSGDAVEGMIATLRTHLRGVLRNQPDDVVALATASSALLLVHADDAHALAMYRRVKISTRNEVGGLLVSPSEELADPRQILSATLALALAAHTMEERELSGSLLGGAFSHTAEIARMRGAPLFWLFASAAFGALGGDDALDASLTINGANTPLTFDHGRAVVALPNARAGSHFDIAVNRTHGSFLATRVEAAFGTPFIARTEGPISLALAGEVGHTGSRSVLELTVSARHAISDSVVDIALPVGANVDDVALSVLRASQNVINVERREPGFVRVSLRNLTEDARVVLPLPFQWQLAGNVRGLGVVAYPEAEPSHMTVLEPRAFSLTLADE